MFSEQFFDLLLNFGDDWKVNDVKVNCLSGEVDVYVSFIGTKADSPESLEIGPFYDHREVRRWRHLDTMQFKTYISCGVPRVRSCKGTTT
jgi:transposase